MIDIDDDDDDEVELIENQSPKGPTAILYGAPFLPWPLSPLERLVEIRNPRELTARVRIHLGNDQRLHVALERLRPEEERLSDRKMKKLLHRMLPIRSEYLNAELVVPPGGTVEIPSGWLPALRKVRDGFVVGGLAHFIEVVGEQNPPTLAAALSDDPPLPSAIRRRDK